MVSPAIIGVGFVVLVLVALGIAYYMGYFDEFFEESEEDDYLDDALDAMIESSTAAPASSSTPASSAAASSAAQASSSSAAVSSSVLSCEEGQIESNGECINIVDLYSHHAGKTWWHIKDISTNKDPDVNNSLNTCYGNTECIGVIRNNRGENFIVKKGDQQEVIKTEDGFNLYVK